jgi:L-ribulose-5-phosphate 4-epimerase
LDSFRYEELRKAVCDANLELQRQNLVIYSWGNVSGIDHSTGVVAIKPSGVAYNELTPSKIVLLDLDGNVVDGTLNPSSDTPTHLELYRNFQTVGGICHTHSRYATMWAQSCKEIPCFGTTHADYFYGPVPVTSVMALGTLQINPRQDAISQALLDKHYLRKHGKDAYYGQT